MVFRAQFMKEQRDLDGDKFDKKDAEELCKHKWGKMGQESRNKYQPAPKTGDEKPKKEKKSKEEKENKKKKSSVSKGKKEEKKRKSMSKNRKSVSKGKKEEKEEKKSGSTNKDRKSISKGKKDEAKKDDKKSGKEEKKAGKAQKKKSEDQLFLNDDEEPVHCWDLPLKMYHNGTETDTTFREQMNGVKCGLVVNVASKCGNTKTHYTQMVELHNKYSDDGF